MYDTYNKHLVRELYHNNARASLLSTVSPFRLQVVSLLTTTNDIVLYTLRPSAILAYVKTNTEYVTVFIHVLRKQESAIRIP